MKMKYMAYTERKQEVREMTIGDMFVSLAESMITANELNLPIRFFWNDSGEFDEFKNMNAMLSSGWNTTWKIRVL